VDGILQGQARADAMYFLSSASRGFTGAAAATIEQTFLEAYRWQYIVSGVRDARFQKILGGMVNGPQMERIGAALAPIIGEAS
jgi:hypothetical protein